MASIAEMALYEAKRLGLDLSVKSWMIPAAAFSFECIEPKRSMLEAFRDAKRDGLPWVEHMPVPVLTYHSRDDKYRIMDGMMRICSSQAVGIPEFPALVASGETYEALEPILDQGYYGEDFIEMLAMVNQQVRENLEKRDRNRLAGA